MAYKPLPWLQDSYDTYGQNYSQPDYSYGYSADPYSMEHPLASLIRGVPAAIYSFQGKDLSALKPIGSQIAALGRAQYDMNDPLYQRTYEAERGQGMMDMAAVISEMSRQNRMQTRLGRTPLFSQERGGEVQFRTLTKGYQDIQSQARQRARQILGAGQNAAMKDYVTQASLAQDKLQNKAMKAGGFGSIADVAGILLRKGMF